MDERFYHWRKQNDGELDGKWEYAERGFLAGREQGMREAARIADGVEAEFLRESTLPDLTGTYSKHCGACASGAGSVEVAILAAIGEGK